MTQNAVTPGEFSLAMEKLGVAGPRPKIAVAVSGGGDSLALAALLQDWAAACGGEVLALTVDHGLRPGSGAEASAAGEILRARGIPHEILRWEGEKPATHVQERARQARYGLLLEACRSRGFLFLAVAHNQEDQAETFWMRLAHGSGLDGLAGMAAAREFSGITVIRPLLGFPRERLRAACAARGIRWIEDPSNRNEKFLRVKLRQFEALLAGEGLTPARLAQTLQKLGDAREALEEMTRQAAAACLSFRPEGYATLKTQAWKGYPRDIQRRVLALALGGLAPAPYPPGFEALEQLRLDLLTPSFSGRTLAACEIFSGPGGETLIVREAAAVEGRIGLSEGRVWDARFRMSGFAGDIAEVGALGEAGVSELMNNINELHVKSSTLEALPPKVRRVLPALWQGGSLFAVPHLGYYSPAAPAAAKAGRLSFVRIV